MKLARRCQYVNYVADFGHGIEMGTANMRKLTNLYRGAFLTAALVAASTPSHATTSTANMNVGITVTAGCNVSVTDINFGNVAASAFTASQTSTSGEGGLFTYTCGATTTTPALTASHGANYTTTNNMLGVLGGTLPYTLNIGSVSTFTGNAQTAQITATIPIQSTLPAVDVYTDAVVLTLSY
jgi:hypothetical protein